MWWWHWIGWKYVSLELQQWDSFVTFKNSSSTSIEDDTEHVLAGRWKFGEDYIREETKRNAKKIQALKPKVIVFGGFDSREIHWISVDCVNYVCYEFRTTPSTKYFDHKSNGPGLKYEYALALRRVSEKSWRFEFSIYDSHHVHFATCFSKNVSGWMVQ